MSFANVCEKRTTISISKTLFHRSVYRFGLFCLITDVWTSFFFFSELRFTDAKIITRSDIISNWKSKLHRPCVILSFRFASANSSFFIGRYSIQITSSMFVLTVTLAKCAKIKWKKKYTEETKSHIANVLHAPQEIVVSD